MTIWLISSSTFNSINSSDIVSPEGIAIDWISRRIYWTDSSKDTIEVASLDDSTLRTVVIQGNLVNPRGIAVDPRSKYACFIEIFESAEQFLCLKNLIQIPF